VPDTRNSNTLAKQLITGRDISMKLKKLSCAVFILYPFLKKGGEYNLPPE
jgi:hypothetical protein